MSTEIQELSPEQLAQIKPYREKWTAIGLNCKPANREQALVHFKEAYTRGEGFEVDHGTQV